MSDSSAGQIVGAVVGAVVGYFYAPAGAAVYGYIAQGAAIGYGLGGAVDPPAGPAIHTPRLADKSFQSSAYGTPLPRIYGTVGTFGNVIYLENGEYKEVIVKEEQGGKGGGGGSTVYTPTYFATFAISLGEVKPGAAIKRIWPGGKLWYNAGSTNLGTVVESNRRAQGFRFYDGTQTEPDPRIEAAVGSANAEAWPNTMYLVFYDLPLEDFGNSLAGCPVKVELVTDGEQPPELINQFVGPSFGNLVDRRIAIPQSFTSTGLSAGVFERIGDPFDVLIVSEFYTNRSSSSWRYSDFSTEDIYFSMARGLNDSGDNYTRLSEAIGGSTADAYDAARDGYQKRSGQWYGLGAGGTGRVYSSLDSYIDLPGSIYTVAVDESGEYGYVLGLNTIYKLSGSVVVDSVSHSIQGTNSSAAGMWHDSGYLWIGVSGTAAGSKNSFYRMPDDLSESPSFMFSLPNVGNSQSFSVGRSYGEFAVYGSVLYRAHVSSQTDGSWIYEQWRIYGLANTGVPLSDIVVTECQRTGISPTFVDTTEIDGIDVRGYQLNPGDSRGALGPLKVAYRFDFVPDGYGIKCVKRGNAPSLVIPWEDLGATQLGVESAPRLTVSREMDTQLPSRYEVQYSSERREYDIGSQYAEFPTPAQNERSIEVPLVLTDNEAAEIADVLINAAWQERTALEFPLPQKYLGLRPGTVVTIETPGREYEARINSRSEQGGQVIKFTARLNNALSYQSSAKGAGGVTPDQEIDLIDDAQTYLLDIPLITSEQDVPGFGAAMGAPLSWPGGALLRSVDGGQSYSNLQGFGGPGTVATARDPLAENDSYALDYDSELVVDVEFGTFQSVSVAQMMTGQNLCAYGADGRWEIIQYADATMNDDTSLSLTTLARGMYGTEWATGMHEPGDMVVLITDLDNAFIGADIGRLGSESLFRGVTNGQPISEVTPFGFTYRGVNLKPYAPLFVGYEVVGSDLQFTVESRTRYPSSYWYTGVQPQNESVMRFEADIMDGSTIKRTLTSADGSFTYTEAQQVEDFGEPSQVLSIRTFQISDRVGRGYVNSISIDNGEDQYFSSVVALLHFDGQDGATTTVEESGKSTITLHGGAEITTDNARFGPSSMLGTGTVSYATLTGSDLALGTGDFTIEMFANRQGWSSFTGGNLILLDGRGGSSANPFILDINSSSQRLLRWWAVGSSRIEQQDAIDAEWVHVAICRIGTTTTMYVGGASVGTWTDSTNYDCTEWTIGGRYTALSGSRISWNGYIDELRVTKGVGRYTENFTPPTQQFPNQ